MIKKKVILKKEVTAILFACSVEVRDITVVKISGVSVFQVGKSATSGGVDVTR